MRIYYEKGVNHILNNFDTTSVFISAIRDKLYSRLSLFFADTGQRPPNVVTIDERSDILRRMREGASGKT